MKIWGLLQSKYENKKLSKHERKSVMKTKKSRKSQSKKNNNYKNVKEITTMKKVNNQSEAIEMVMKNQQAAHNNMTAIVKTLHEHMGLTTSFLNSTTLSAMLDTCVRDFESKKDFMQASMEQYEEDLVECFYSLLELDEDGIEHYNTSYSIETQFGLFAKMVIALITLNQKNRPALLNNLAELTAKYKDTENDRISERAWLLFMFLTDPRLVTLVA